MAAALGVCLVMLSACGTPGPNRADLAAAIARNGQASIEGSSSGGGHFRVFYIDGVFVAAGKVYGIYPISPGIHTVGIEAEFPKRSLTKNTIDGGNTTLTVEMRAGVRYAITGHLRGPGVTEVQVVEVASSAPAGPSQTILMSTTDQNQFANETPTVVPIPKNLRNSNQLAVSAGVVVAPLLLRKYYDGEPPPEAWAEAPGPAVLMAVHDEMKIKEALVMRLHRKGYSLCADQQNRIEFSHRSEDFVSALNPLHEVEIRMVFDDFLFQETPAGIRVCASRTLPEDAREDGSGATVQMNRRTFAELRALLESIRTDLGG